MIRLSHPKEMQFNRLTITVRDHPLIFAWSAFATYAASAAVLVQFLILPILAPSLHAGNGLLLGQDSIAYHAIALEMAENIRQTSWSAWSLAPEGHPAAGLAAPFYYFLSASPWSLIPINAALHATAGTIVMQLIRQLGVPWAVAFAGGSLWVLLPSSFQWMTQIQKDGYYFAGMLGVLLAMTLLLRAPAQKSAWSRIFAAGALLCLGLLCAGAARIYGLMLVQVVSCFIALFAIAFFAYSIISGSARVKPGLLAILIFLLLPVALLLVPPDNRLKSDLPAPENPAAAGTYLAESTILQTWHPSGLLPNSVDRIFLRLSVAREGYFGTTYKNSGSWVDFDIHFSNASEVVAYLPRALQIGLLAPFPEHWLAPGVSPGGTIMRRVVGVEMVLLYPMLLIGLPLAFWRWRSLPEFWLILFFCMPIVLAYSYTTPNLGTLYRLRYGFVMTMAGVGLSAICMTVLDWRARVKN